jgi:DNA-binding CsgD family transcriptional regulator
VGSALAARAIPGTLPALEHSSGLILLARGDDSAVPLLRASHSRWQALARWWDTAWASVDLGVAAAKARRRGEAARRLAEAGAMAAAPGAAAIIETADRLRRSYDDGRPAEPWSPLSAREFEVAELVAAGMTNRQIAERLVVAPKTVSAHIAHILAKLGASRRAEIAAWCAAVRRDAQP